MANVLWTQVLGIMHLARSRVGIREIAPGVGTGPPVDVWSGLRASA